MMPDPEITITEIANLVSRDPAMVAALLFQISNQVVGLKAVAQSISDNLPEKGICDVATWLHDLEVEILNEMS